MRPIFDALVCAAAQGIDLPLDTGATRIRGCGTLTVIW